MKINKWISLLLVIIVSSVFLIGCKANGKNTVVFIPQILNNGEYWDNISNSIKQEAENQGYNYKVLGSEEWSEEKQSEVILNAIKEKADVIILAPIGTTGLFDAIKEANKANIPIILVDTDINRELIESYGAYISTYIGIDNYAGGEQIGNIVINKLPKGAEVAVLTGNVNSGNGDERCQGFYDVAVKNEMKVVAELSTQWNADDGYEKAKLIFEAYPNIKGVFAVNSEVYAGINKAAKEKNMSIIGGTFDCNDATMKLINEGELECSFDQNIEAIGKNVIEVVNKLMSGETVDKVTVTEGKIITRN